MDQIVFDVVESPEGGYEASALGHRIHTQGESLEELREMVRDAVRCHFEDNQQPKVIRLIFTRQEVMAA